MRNQPSSSHRGAPLPRDEPLRHSSLASYDILDTAPEVAFDDLARLAARLLEVPIGLVSLVDAERQWFKARVGLDAIETPREDSFCAWAIIEPPDAGVFFVPDATQDSRFAANPLVTGAPGIRFYAGAPVRSPEGFALGTICVIDTKARAVLDDQARDTLVMLARHVGQQLEFRRAAKHVALSEARLRALVDNASDIILVLRDDGTISYVSAAAEQVLGWDPSESIGSNALELVHPDDAEVVLGSFARTADVPGLNVPLEFKVAHADGSWVPVEAVANNRLDDPAVRGIVIHVRDIRARRITEERVQRGERQLADAQRLAGMGSWEWDLRTNEMTWSAGLFALFGLDPRTTAPSAYAWAGTIDVEERKRVRALVADARAIGVPFSFRRRIVRPDGIIRMADSHGEFDLDAAGEATKLRGTIVDITQSVAAEAALEDERHFLRAVLDSLEEGIVACDADGRLSLFNPATERFHGLSLDSIPSESWAEHYDLFEADGTTALATESVPLLRAFEHGQVKGEEMVIAPKRGPRRLVSCNGRAIFDGGGSKIGAVVAMRDITGQRRAEAALRHLADHDVLTDLPNRSVFSNRLEAALRAGDNVAIVFIDLDDFKQINDEYGHNVGDQVLVTSAARIRAALKVGDTPARIGGDEFVVLCTDVHGEAMASDIACRLQAVLAEPFMAGGMLFTVGASVGFAVPSPGETDAEGLLVRADHAMYANKGARRS